MSNHDRFRAARLAAKEAYLAGNKDFEILAEAHGVAPRTVYHWAQKGRWAQMALEEKNLRLRAEVARQRAIVTALEEFAADPRNVHLQSLVALLRSEAKRLEPAKELNDYIVKFLDQMTDFFIEKDYPGLLKELQAVTFDLAAYLQLRNS